MKVGDKVWLADCETRAVQVTCPVCFGKRVVTLILGDESRRVLECDFCKRGCEAATGTVTEHQWQANVLLVTVGQIERHETAEGATEELYAAYGDYDARRITGRVFGTEAEAQAACVRRCAEHEADCREDMKRARTRKDRDRKYPWNVGYHTTQANRARKDMERHEALAGMAREQKREGGA